jgi:GR25 family glycosyltransferase involved in LPS biosynthesis
METYLKNNYGDGFNFVRAMHPANLTSFPPSWGLSFRSQRPATGGSTQRFKQLMACTTSHLEAIYTAVSNHVLRPDSFPLNYALILEDDIRFQFHVLDWDALVASAPKGTSSSLFQY